MITTYKEKTTFKERPIIISEKIGNKFAELTSKDHKKIYGQYLTPSCVADFMSSMTTQLNKSFINILDPGIGTGTLSCSICEYLSNNSNVNTINLIGYEIDKTVIDNLNQVLKYLTSWLKEKNIQLQYKIIQEDFILTNSNIFEASSNLFDNKNNSHKFDIIISNPPYFKINKSDPRAKIASKVVYGQPNIYSIFLILASELLSEDGDLIFITPRSFTSGFYFKAFRNIFFSKIAPIQLHLFNSRKEAFRKDDVLQEHIIIHGKKIKNNLGKKVIISFSNGSKDLNNLKSRITKLNDVIDYKTPNKFIYLPKTEKEDKIIDLVNSWNGSLHKYKMEISTGKVVPFRAKNLLLKSINHNLDYAPLIWLNHINNNEVIWPIKDFRKEQYMLVNDKYYNVLVKNKNYVLMRRFSPKEDKKRINTAPFFKKNFSFEFIGFENHVNFIFGLEKDLSKEIIVGLSAILNSTIIDIYFRTFNGNTEVSASEIRDLSLPELKIIKEIGIKIIFNQMSFEEVDNFLLSN